MKVIIDIDEEEFEMFKGWVADGCANIEQEMIAMGTPLPKGEWKNVGFMTCECNKCKEQFHELEANNYCPNCGNYMKGGAE